MINIIITYVSIFILAIILLVIVGCAKAEIDQPLTVQNDTDYTFMVYVNDGNYQLPNINAKSGQTYTWESLNTACYMGSCEMMISVMDGGEVLYIMLDPVKENIIEWTQLGESDICIQESNNTFHLFPGCSKK
jgi:hypothetical protein